MDLTQDHQQVIEQALSIISGLYKREPLSATNSIRVKQYCQLQIAHLEHEVFAVLHLDNKRRLINFEPLSRGTIDSASVYPREVVKASLFANSAEVIFTHNHPSSVAAPSHADIALTARLVDALELLDIRVLDHIVVGQNDAYSFAEAGLL